MCGILGYSGPNIDIIKRAHALQKHRGPDGEGFYSDGHVSLGHNRLAIIDLNPRAAQPMWDTTRRYCIVFNGEIYNYKEIKAEHLQDYNFQTESDTEVLLGLFVKYGTDLTQYIRGMYAFAIYDATDKKLFLFRDEFGIKPLFYSVGDFGICFASEVKTIVSIRKELGLNLTLDQNSILTYLTLGHTITPETVYSEVKLLEPGTVLTYNLIEKNFAINKEVAFESLSISSEDYSKIFESAIGANLVADVPVGIFFSGGVDSSLIGAICNKLSNQIKTFSVNIIGRNIDEPYIKKIADHLNLNNHLHDFDVNDFETTYTSVLNTLDNPSGANGIFQTYYISKLASKEVKVVLLGDGGDELFYGYNRSLVLGKFESPTKAQSSWFDILYLNLPSFKGKNYIFHHLAIMLKKPLSFYMNEMSIERDQSDKTAWTVTSNAILKKNISPNKYDYHLYLQDGLLIKNDIATSLCSIEGRLPILDKDIYKYSEQYAKVSLATGISKFWLKKELGAYLPDNLVHRKKAGFGINYKKIVTQSDLIKKDYSNGVLFLQDRGINFNFKSYAGYTTKNSQMPIVVNSLYRALLNNEKIFGKKIK